MANAPGWKQDPARNDRERYWSGSNWTERVRPAGKAGSLHVPEHVPHLQRALSAATADIDAVEDRLSMLFERADGARLPGSSSPPPPAALRAETFAADDEVLDLYGNEDDVVDGPDEEVTDGDGPPSQDEGTGDETDAAFAELDAVLASEQPDEPDQVRRKLFRRHA
jgi:Protein of unknown function (DUF2510)